jgi:peptidoglycan/xylan/chitin deacetylase (PgdA/CDA1 family)
VPFFSRCRSGFPLAALVLVACASDVGVFRGSSATTSIGAGGSGGRQADAGGSDGGSRGLLVPPPEPPGSEVPQPSATVTSSNLRVLPWAGFKAALTFTFDDSQPSQTEHWPELQAIGAPLTFFIQPSTNTQSGFDASWSAIAAAGSELGNHTFTHCHASLADCTPVGTQADEIEQTTAYITSHLGVTAVYSFAAPYGDTGWNPYAAPRFLLGRGVASGIVPAAGVSDWYNLPVFAVAAGQTATDFDAGIDMARARGAWSIFLFHSLLPTTQNWYAGVQIADVTAGAAYAQSFGDVWLDSMLAIGAYARAKQMFEKLTPNANTWTWTLPDHFPPGRVLRVTVDGGSLSQDGVALAWNSHGYYEVALDAGTLTWSP